MSQNSLCRLSLIRTSFLWENQMRGAELMFVVGRELCLLRTESKYAR